MILIVFALKESQPKNSIIFRIRNCRVIGFSESTFDRTDSYTFVLSSFVNIKRKNKNLCKKAPTATGKTTNVMAGL